MLSYPIELEPDDNDTLLVTFPDFPEAQTFGVDKSDALRRAQDALATIVDEYVRKWRRIPPPSSGRLRIPVPALTAAKLQLYDVMLEEGIGKADLARLLKWHPPQVDRLFDVFHHSRLDQLEQAVSAVGKRIVVIIEDEPGTGADEPLGPASRIKSRPVGIRRATRRRLPHKASSSTG